MTTNHDYHKLLFDPFSKLLFDPFIFIARRGIPAP
jgi:hypothetical protein